MKHKVLEEIESTFFGEEGLESLLHFFPKLTTKPFIHKRWLTCDMSCNNFIFLLFTFSPSNCMYISIRDHYQHSTYRHYYQIKNNFSKFFFFWKVFSSFFKFLLYASQLFIMPSLINKYFMGFRGISKRFEIFQRFTTFGSVNLSSTYFSWPSTPLFTCKLKSTLTYIQKKM